MKAHLKNACRISAIAIVATVTAGCASRGYSPPEGPRAAETCPIGEAWVCRDHYPSRLEREGEPPLVCMCEDLQKIR